MTIDNKERFRNGQYSKAWSEITGGEAYVEAVNTAMLVMVAAQVGDNSPTAYAFRLEGARQFLGILSNLTTERKETKIEDQNLKTNI